MDDPFPVARPASERARAARRLRRAVDAALRDGAGIARQGGPEAVQARALLNRLEQIGRELDAMAGLHAEPPAYEAHPFWTELLNRGSGR